MKVISSAPVSWNQKQCMVRGWWKEETELLRYCRDEDYLAEHLDTHTRPLMLGDGFCSANSSVLPAGGGKATAPGCIHTPRACPWGFHPSREAYEVAMPRSLLLALQRAGTALCCVQVHSPSGKEGAGGNAAGCTMSENLGCTQQPHNYTLFC